MSTKKDYNFSYKKSGVDIKKADYLIAKARPIIKKTNNNNSLGEIGGFGGLFNLNPIDYKKPILVAATDGVGTKLLIAKELNTYNTLGIDLVAMSVNDVIVQGATNLFFLDYIAINKLNEKVFLSIIKGIARGCKQSSCSLIGGETAELPGIYPKGGFDLAGFCVGVVEKSKLLPNKKIRPGNVLLGLPSSGLHSNGFTLIRKILNEKRYKLSKNIFAKKSLGEILLKPTKIYVKPILNALNASIKINAMAHITGGGLIDNLKRVFTNKVGFTIYKKNLAYMKKNNVFYWLKNDCRISEKELIKTFNCGVGMVLVVPEKEVERVIDHFRKKRQSIFHIGKVTADKSTVIT